jgi:hypothetical protein
LTYSAARLSTLSSLGTVRSLYPFALAEGEGVGTAYEYVAKAAFIEPLVKELAQRRQGGTPRVLVAGLPEKYGTSLDFAILAHRLDVDLLVADDRPAAIERAQKAIEALQHGGRLRGLRVAYRALPTLAEVTRLEPHDAVLTCEVLQRVPVPSRGAFADGLRSIAPRGALFVPNSENASHLKISGLHGVSGDEIGALFPGAVCGYVDMPPFPPGIIRSADQRSRASTGLVEAVAMRGLDAYCRGEPLVPAFVKKHFAHIACAMWGV